MTTLHGEPIQVGDKVWDIRYGWTEVIEVNEEYDYPIITNRNAFTKDGKLFINGLPTLFWGEIKFEIPKKPIPKFEKDEKVMASYDGNCWHKRYYSHYDGAHYCFSDGATSWSKIVGTSTWKFVRKPNEEELV